MLPSPALGVFCSEVLGPMGFSREVTDIWGVGVLIFICWFTAKSRQSHPQPHGTQL